MKMRLTDSSQNLAAKLYAERRKFEKNETVSPAKLSKLQKTPLDIMEQLVKTKGTISNPR